jgi:hypothetical protein
MPHDALVATRIDMAIRDHAGRFRRPFKAKQIQYNPGNIGGGAPPDPGGVNPFG